jgi:riboflavin kinase/FMN adenylyltransferase
MEIIRDPRGCPRRPGGTAVTIGAYDGVHRGHQAVIAAVRETARQRDLETAVVTFDRHPASVVRPESAPNLLTDLDQRLQLLEIAGVDLTVVVPFDAERAEESAEDFIRSVLVECLSARLVVVGADFHFGHQRRGNVELLRSEGARHGFDVEGMELVGADWREAAPDGRVSSTLIRRSLIEGDVVRAAALLGRHHEVRGTVVKGDQRGRTLGFPTANLEVRDRIQLPADGVYAAWYVRPNGDIHPAAASLGRRPTFYDDQPHSLVEAHLLDVDLDLYGERGGVQFVEHLRGQKKFSSVDDLVQQMHRDIGRARTILGVGGE